MNLVNLCTKRSGVATGLIALAAQSVACAAADVPVSATHPVGSVPLQTSSASARPSVDLLITRYVSLDGHDGSPGTRAEPLRTIDQGLRSRLTGGSRAIASTTRWPSHRATSTPTTIST